MLITADQTYHCLKKSCEVKDYVSKFMTFRFKKASANMKFGVAHSVTCAHGNDESMIHLSS